MFWGKWRKSNNENEEKKEPKKQRDQIQPEPPIYKKIQHELLKQGKVTSSLQLDHKYSGNDQEIKCAPGMMDGVTLYHTIDSVDVPEALMRLIILELESKQDQLGTIEDFTENYENTVLSYADSLVSNLYEMLQEKPALVEKIYDLTARLISEGRTVSGVKLGIVMSCLFATDGQESFISELQILGKHEEFTFHALVSLENKLFQEKYNQLCWDYAKEFRGWGKVHAIEHIECPSEEIKNWILQKGCLPEDSLSMYLGWTCYELGQVEQMLAKGSLTKEELKGITNILVAMENDGPVVGLEALEDSSLMMEGFVNQLEKNGLVENAEAVLKGFLCHLDFEKHMELTKRIQNLLEE